jgi:hypothetical protein
MAFWTPRQWADPRRQSPCPRQSRNPARSRRSDARCRVEAWQRLKVERFSQPATRTALSRLAHDALVEGPERGSWAPYSAPPVAMGPDRRIQPDSDRRLGAAWRAGTQRVVWNSGWPDEWPTNMRADHDLVCRTSHRQTGHLARRIRARRGPHRPYTTAVCYGN